MSFITATTAAAAVARPTMERVEAILERGANMLTVYKQFGLKFLEKRTKFEIYRLKLLLE